MPATLVSKPAGETSVGLLLGGIAVAFWRRETRGPPYRRPSPKHGRRLAAALGSVPGNHRLLFVFGALAVAMAFAAMLAAMYIIATMILAGAGEVTPGVDARGNVAAGPGWPP